MLKSRFNKTIIGVILISLVILFIILKFVQASGGFSFDFDTKIWAQFGTVIGSILLVFTIIIQLTIYKRQQIENNFFQLIRNNNEILNDMKTKSVFTNYGDKIKGRSAIGMFLKQYKVAYSILLDLINENRVSIKEFQSNDCSIEKDFLFKNIDVAFYIAYYGVTIESKKSLSKAIKEKYIANEIINEFSKFPSLYVKSIKDNNQYIGFLKQKLDSIPSPILFSKNSNLNYSKNSSKLFTNNQDYLDLYFRSIFRTTEYIDKQKLLNNGIKQDYINVLCAHMSIQEQTLLLLYSISTLNRTKDNKALRNYICKYQMIKDVPINSIPDLDIKKYYPKIQFITN